MIPFTLSSDRLLLDAPTAADIDDIARYCQDPIFERFLTIPWPYNRSDAVFFVEEFVPRGWADGSELSWAIRLATGGPLLGVIGLRLPAAEVGFWLGADHRGHGYMPEAVAVVADLAFGTNEPGVGGAEGEASVGLGLDELHWECIAGNLASTAVARKCGFTPSGAGPSRLPHRDGSHPESWRAALRASDSRDLKRGWPA